MTSGLLDSGFQLSSVFLTCRFSLSALRKCWELYNLLFGYRGLCSHRIQPTAAKHASRRSTHIYIIVIGTQVPNIYKCMQYLPTFLRIVSYMQQGTKFLIKHIFVAISTSLHGFKFIRTQLVKVFIAVSTNQFLCLVLVLYNRFVSENGTIPTRNVPSHWLHQIDEWTLN